MPAKWESEHSLHLPHIGRLQDGKAAGQAEKHEKGFGKERQLRHDHGADREMEDIGVVWDADERKKKTSRSSSRNL